MILKVLIIMTGMLIFPNITTASPVKEDETIIFFPGNAYLTGSVWMIPIHGWVFEKEHNSLWRELIIDNFPELMEVETDEASRSILEQRAHMFLVDNKRNKDITVVKNDKSKAMNPSKPNGHFFGRIYVNKNFVGDLEDNGWMSYQALPKKGDKATFTGKVQLIKPQGVSVISDIDDTIKISNVQDKKALVQNTFFKEFSPVPGMAEIYKKWQDEEEAVFHYLSASPWHLYPALSDFIVSSGFPDGSYNLKNFRMKDETFFNLFSSQQEYKQPIVENLLEKYPGRRFILVGDAGEEDPEIFANVARQFPQQVLHIFIRDLNADAAQSDRYKTTFKGIPDTRWSLFREGSDLQDFILPEGD